MSGGDPRPASTTRLHRLLFPDPPRELPGRRGIKIALRAAHVLCAALLVGSHVFAADPELRAGWMSATVATGILILGLDLHESAAFLFQVRGLVVAVKLATLLSLPAVPAGSRGWVLAALLVGSVVSSHAPSAIRYRVLFFRDRVRPGRSKG